MAHFANKIQTVYYEDSTYSTVCIEYEDDFGQLRRHSIPADPTNSDYKFCHYAGNICQHINFLTQKFIFRKDAFLIYNNFNCLLCNSNLFNADS